jgi:CRP-like cAMP-binding protein
LRIHIRGNPNQFRRRGRKSTVFAPKSSRVVRQFLLDPSRGYRQQELIEATGLGQGFVSRILNKLEQDNLVRRVGPFWRVDNPGRLLDAWGESL